MAWDGTAGANEVGTAVVTEPACCSIYMKCLEEQSFPQFRACNKQNWMDSTMERWKEIR